MVVPKFNKVAFISSLSGTKENPTNSAFFVLRTTIKITLNHIMVNIGIAVSNIIANKIDKIIDKINHIISIFSFFPTFITPIKFYLFLYNYSIYSEKHYISVLFHSNDTTYNHRLYIQILNLLIKLCKSSAIDARFSPDLAISSMVAACSSIEADACCVPAAFSSDIADRF